MPQPPEFAFRGVVRITRLGISYLVFTFFLGLSALNTGNNSLYIAGSLMLAALLISGLLSWRALRRVDITFESANTPWAGAPARGEMMVVNSSRWFSPRDVILVSPQLERPVLVDQIQRGTRRVIPVSLLFERRGRTSLQALELYCRYPFGLFLKRWVRSLEGNVIVLPRLLAEESDRHTVDEKSGSTEVRDISGMGSDIYGFREYVPGDSLRQVNWKKSARIGRWILRQQQAERDGTLHLAVDPWLPDPALREQFEREISRATTLIHRTAESVTLHFPGETLRSANSGKRALLEALALLEPSPEQRQLVVPRGTKVYGLAGEGGSRAAVA